MLKILYSGMKNTKHVKITEFGTFKSLNKRERTGRNPKTKVLSKISPRKVITFKGSKLLIKKLNTKKNDKET